MVFYVQQCDATTTEIISFHIQHGLLRNAFNSHSLPIYVKAIVVAYVVMPSPFSSLVSSPLHGVGVL
jgi:hypothetical protein